MRIAITGATGNVGTALLRRLADERDIEVIGIVRRPPAPDAGAPYDRVQWHSADLSEPGSVADLVNWFTEVDAVVHLAWQAQPSQDRARLRRINLNGVRHVLTAMREAQVTNLLYASSTAVYTPGPKNRTVDERWPISGLGRSGFSVDKAAVEALLDRIELDRPNLRLVRLRQTLVLQYDAGAEITRYFLGRLIPRSLLRSGRFAVVPRNQHLRLQVVHADDVAEAYLLALRGEHAGTFNIAAEPVLDGQLVAAEMDCWAPRVPMFLLRLLNRLAWRTRLVPAEEGWLELAAAVPLVDCSRAARELGWQPRHDARETLRELLSGVDAGAGTATAPMRPSHRQRSTPATRRPA